MNRTKISLIAFAALTLLTFANSTQAAPGDEINLTGKWSCNDEGTYFIRQVGKEIWWLGKSANDGQDWTNVFHGTIRGRTLKGDWADVPQGGAAGSGSMTFELVFRDGTVVEIKKEKQVGDEFGGENWKRAE